MTSAPGSVKRWRWLNKAIDKFSNVDQNTEKVNELVGEITAASNDQAQGIEQLNSGVDGYGQRLFSRTRPVLRSLPRPPRK